MLIKALTASLIGLLAIAYPLIVYYLLANDLPLIGAALVTAIVIWKIKNRGDWLLWVTGLLILVVVTGYFIGPEFISKLSPLLIHFSLFSLFGYSLKTTPLIERFARMDFPELPPGIAEYCRNLTIVWTAFFALNIVACIWMAIYGNNKFWALYNGLFVYLLIALLVVGEYVWRRLRFPDLDIPDFRQTLENMIKNGPQVWAKNDEYDRPAK